MKRRFSDEQIIGMITEYEAGVKAQELCRKYGIRRPTGECKAIADRQRCDFL